MTVTATQFRDFAAQFIGGDYGFCDRCGGSCYDRTHDCSGLQCHASNGTGLTRHLCTTSFVMAQMCTDLGLEMTVQQAEADNGPDVWWAFHGADHGRVDDGSRPNGASGHIVLVVRVRDANGKTIGFYTIEAMGRRYGIVRGSYFGRRWTGHYRIPGVVSGSLPPPPPPAPELKEQDMVILPGVARPESRIRWAAPASSGEWIWLFDGGKVLGMDDVHPGDPPERRRWYPKNADGSHAGTSANPLIGLTKDAKYLIAGRLDGGIYRGEIDAS